MSEEGVGIGAILRAAREEKGWTIQDVSGRLRLMTRQIEAIEADDFSRLGQPVFARGFVRNYARLLGLDADELLGQMIIADVAKVQEPESVPFTPSQEFWKSPWVLGAIGAVAMAIAIPVGLYWWLTSGEEQRPAAAAVEQPAPPPPPPPAPIPEGQQQAAAPAAPAAEQPAPAAGETPPAGTPAAPQAAAQATAKTAPSVSPATPPVAAAPAADLRLQFDEISWVQVRDSSGQIVHSGLNPAGTSVDVAGKAPFYLVIGNADKVRLTYKGKAIDLKPFTSVDVARLTLNP